MEPLKSEWKRYSERVIQPINLETMDKACANRTTSKKGCRAFLGYALAYKGMSSSLSLYMDGELAVEYLAFKQARGNAMSTLIKVFKSFVKVVRHLAAIADASMVAKIEEFDSGLKNIFSDLGYAFW